jgi:adenosylcobinamide-phosphate synthase
MSLMLALLIDWWLGEPPLLVHPVVWFGNYLKFAERLRGGKLPLFWGGLTFFLGVGIVLGIVGGLNDAIGHLPLPIRILLTGILLKPAFAFRMLVREVTEIELALQQDLEQGRQRLAYIVSRDTTVLAAIEVRESALESISENLSDSVIAPLFWFLVAGLPGAYVYRFVNTADAMWGYRDAKYEKWGKVAARTDDGLNWIPARITGIWLLYFPVGARFPRPQTPRSTDHSPEPIAQLIHESHKTPSPNSGWSMAAFAIRLGVHLGKPGVYMLNPSGADVDADVAIAGIRWISRSGWVLALIMALLGGLRFEFRGWLYG